MTLGDLQDFGGQVTHLARLPNSRQRIRPLSGHSRKMFQDLKRTGALRTIQRKFSHDCCKARRFAAKLVDGTQCAEGITSHP